MTQTHNCIKAITERFDGPFEQPVIFDRETGDLRLDFWMIKMYNLTKSGSISKVGGGYLRIVFCPLCGERLIPEDNDDE